MIRRIPSLPAYIAAFPFLYVSFAVYTFIYNFAQNAYYPKGEICPQTEKSSLGLDRVHNPALHGLCTLSTDPPDLRSSSVRLVLEERSREALLPGRLNEGTHR